MGLILHFDPTDFYSARVRMPLSHADLRDVQPQCPKPLECDGFVRGPKEISNMPLFFQLPEDFDGFVHGSSILGSLNFYRIERSGPEASVFNQFTEMRKICHNVAMKFERSLGPKRQEYLWGYVRIEKERDRGRFCVYVGSDIPDPGQLVSQILDHADPGLSDLYRELEIELANRVNPDQSPPKRIYERFNSRMIVSSGQFHTIASIQFPIESPLNDLLFNALKAVSLPGDYTYITSSIYPMSYDHERAKHLEIAKDWSMASCGGYSEEMNPLVRPKRKLGRYGWIQPLFHLSNDVADYDSGVYLDAVHRRQGSFLELHSFEGRQVIEQSVDVFASAIAGFDRDLDPHYSPRT